MSERGPSAVETTGPHDATHDAIAIVGIGARFAGAEDLSAFWALTAEGRDAFGPVPPDRWDDAAFFDENPRSRDKSYAPHGAFIDDVRTFPAIALQIPPRRVDVMDPQQRFSIECCLQAIEDSGRTPDELPRRTGVYMGVTAMEYGTLATTRIVAQLMATGALGTAPEDPSVIAKAVERVLPARPFSAPGVLSNMVAAAVAQELRLHGPAFTTDAACASALVALHASIESLRSGSIDCALAGGVYLCLTPQHHIAFSRIGAISKSGYCRPFDARADGFVEGDGCGVVMLKRHADALRDGDRIYGLIHGVGMNNDGGGTGPMAPVIDGQIEVVRRAWQDAHRSGVDPSRLGYVETHGTGTFVGDKIEFDGLCASVGDAVERAALGSSKANFGHTMSAAGVLGLIRAVMALHHETIPPMAGFESPKDQLGIDGTPFYIPQQATEWKGAGRLAAVSSFGFGGTNVHVVVGAADSGSRAAAARPTIPSGAASADVAAAQPELLLMSAPDEVTLRRLAGRTADAVANDAHATVAGVSRAWAKRRRQAARLAVVATTKDELVARLRAVAAGDYPDGVAIGTLADPDADAPRVAFMYPGQGAQRVGMIAGIRDRFPAVAETLDAMDAASEGVLERPISHYLYPERQGAAAPDPEAAFDTLTATEHCQPALFAVGLGLTRVLEQVGVKPAVVCGHSVGEFTAAAVAGVVSPEEGLRWTARRGRGMADMGGDRGAMAAIVADRATVEALLVPGVVLANLNHPRQIVVSGATDAVRQVVAKAEAQDLKAVELRVSHGFHSPVFADLDLSDAVAAIPFHDPAIPVASCIQDHPYANADEARAVFTAHATSPVLWTDALAQCEAVGADIYLQVGAGGPLVSFANGTLPKGAGKIALSLADKHDDDGGASLLKALGQLFVAGVDVDTRPITAAAELASVPPLVLPRERYWIVEDTASRANRVELVASSRAAQPAAHTATVPAEPEAAPAPATSGVAEIVMAAVARASAYPREALRPSMRLGDDLGFDSMMVADLAEELGKAIPGFSGIPQELLINRPTIQAIIAYAEAGDFGDADGAGAADDDSPLTAYAPTWVDAALPTWGAATAGRTGAAALDQRQRTLSEGEGGGAGSTDTTPRELTPGRFVAIGDAAEDLAAALISASWTRVDRDTAADLIVYAASHDEPTPVRAVLAGEAEAHDPAGDFIAALDAQANAGAKPDVLVLRRADDPWAEALSGAVRAVAREWPTAVVKTISDAPGVDVILAELASFDRSVDVRYDGGTRRIAGTTALPAAAAGFEPRPDDVVLVTGGTRGIGRDLGLALADKGARVLLLGRSTPEDAPTHERVSYVLADVTDGDALRAALEAHDPVTVLIHAAGVLADGPLGSVSAEAGQRARDVKVRGFLEALKACGASLRVALGVGSWAGRFGNANQAHYAAANALLAEIARQLPERIRGVVSEFGPWTDSDMARSIPAAMQQAMRAQGVDFVGPVAGQAALLEDLGRGRGVVVRGRRVPSVLSRRDRRMTLSTETHPYLLDHAIDGVPVMPLAVAATAVADHAFPALDAHPFEVRDLTLYQGVTVSEPVSLHVVIDGARAQISQQSRQGDKETLSYKATVRALDVADVTPLPVQSGGKPPEGLSLADFYAHATFHGPLLQGIESIDAVGDTFVQGKVRTSVPRDWIPGAPHDSWGIDPLAFDSAMQLTAWVAYTRYGRAGTPVGFGRFVQLAPWPEHAVLDVQAVFANRDPGETDDNRFSADITFRDADGTVIAHAVDVVAQMQAVDKAAVEAAVAADEPFEVKREWVDVSAWRDYKDLMFRLTAVEAMGMKVPYFDMHQGTARNTSIIDDREVVNYSSYNYLGLSGDERVIERVYEAMKRYGTSVSASRVASGERPFHRELELALAKAQGVEDAVCMAGGHATNVNTIGHLFGPKDLIIHDELIHDSCLQGIKLSGASRRSFRHDDYDHLATQLRELRRHYEKVLILVEGVYSMDGDIADLPRLIALKKQHGCMLMVDEAHSFGTVGKTGYGVGEHFKDLGADIDPMDVDLWMGTMSKSLAAMGGWIAGKKALITYLRYTTPGFVFAAGIPPTLGVAALASLQIWTEETWRVRQLQANCKRFWQLLTERGLDTGPAKGDSPVIPVITGDSMHALQLSDELLKKGINAKPIIFPAVANDAARLRFFMTAVHTDEQLVFTADTIAETLADIRAGKKKK